MTAAAFRQQPGSRNTDFLFYTEYAAGTEAALSGNIDTIPCDAPFPIIQSKRCMRIPSSADPVNKIRKDTAISRQKNCNDSFIFFPHVAAPPAFMRDTSFFVSTIQGKYLGIVLEMFLKY